MKKTLLISIDAEGDNFWEWIPGEPITTNNAKYVERFQKLCEKYGFKPTYLVNYEMACDRQFVELIKTASQKGNCEVGMHLHAWNTPPLYNLQIRSDIKPGECSYLIEYPSEVMEQKIKFMTELLEATFGNKPIVHRAGRWAMNNLYFQLLNKYGYQVDCSVTPRMNMTTAKGFTENSKGSNYEFYPESPYFVNNTNLLEIPMTVKENHNIKRIKSKNPKAILWNICKAIKGRGPIWFRPNATNLEDLKYLAKVVAKSQSDYLMFMLHTSEMMPGGSPFFKSEEDIEQLYEHLEELFTFVSRLYVGETIGEYAKKVYFSNRG